MIQVKFHGNNLSEGLTLFSKLNHLEIVYLW